MMHVQDKKRNQDATFWSVAPDGYGGDICATPVLIKVRWEERQERFKSTVDLREIVSQAVVYVGQDMKVGDYLHLGDGTAFPDPSVLPASFKIQRFDISTDLRSASNVRMAIL